VRGAVRVPVPARIRVEPVYGAACPGRDTDCGHGIRDMGDRMDNGDYPVTRIRPYADGSGRVTCGCHGVAASQKVCTGLVRPAARMLVRGLEACGNAAGRALPVPA
jgi:hypothetical protein